MIFLRTAKETAKIELPATAPTSQKMSPSCSSERRVGSLRVGPLVAGRLLAVSADRVSRWRRNCRKWL